MHVLNGINFKNQQWIKFNGNSPIMRMLGQPQIMHVKYTGRSTFFKFKQYNEGEYRMDVKPIHTKLLDQKLAEQFPIRMTKFLTGTFKAEIQGKNSILNSLTYFVNRD